MGIRPDFLLLHQNEDRIAILEEVIDDLPDGDPGLPPDRNNLLHLIQEEVETWRALHRDIVREYGRGLTLNTYLQRLDLSSKMLPPAPNAVQCITMHRSKGLQFKHVYVIGMAQEVFPSYRALQQGGRWGWGERRGVVSTSAGIIYLSNRWSYRYSLPTWSL